MFNTLSSTTNLFITDLSNLNDRMLTAQRQVSSGLRMQDVSDDPDHDSALLSLKANIAHNDQLKINLSHVQTEVNSAEGAVNTATTLMDNARQIATEANNGTTQVSTRTQLADQVKDLITQIFGITNTTVEGRYVFSGNDDSKPPYQSVDLTQANGLGTYQGSNATRQIEHPNGTQFSVSITASQIFDHGGPSTSVLQSLTALYNDLVNNNTTNLAADATSINTASDYLDGQQALYGQIQNQVSDAITYQGKVDTQYQAQLSTLQDADAVSAITTLQQETVAQQAALQAHAAMPTKSLFSYLG